MIYRAADAAHWTPFFNGVTSEAPYGRVGAKLIDLANASFVQWHNSAGLARLVQGDFFNFRLGGLEQFFAMRL